MKLEQFLVKAKVNAYAGAGEGGEGLLPDDSKELTFEEGAFRYRDRYFGWNPFIGEEVVWKDDEIVWGMNYYGLVFDEVIPAVRVYAFLQRAMNQVNALRPFRGPDSMREDEFEYIDESQGTLARFAGEEKTFYQGREIYRLQYHGGSIRAK